MNDHNRAFKPKFVASRPLLLLGLVILGVLVAVVAWRFYQGRQGGEREVAQLVKDVSKLMVLPESIPTVATVTDKAQLAGQNFFKSAENGDKVLIYTQEQKAVLYRPTTKRVIEVAPIHNIPEGQAAGANLPEVAGATDPSPTSSPTPVLLPILTSKIALYNGTNTAGLTVRMEEIINQQFQANITTRQNATLRNYANTIVIDVNRSRPSEAQRLATAIGARVGILPASEATPAADLAIIIGSDFSNR